MELGDRAFPLTRGQLDIWLAQETGHAGTEWQLGLFVRIEGTVKPDLLERAIGHVAREAEPVRVAFFEVNGQVFQRVIDDPEVGLACYDLCGAGDPVQEAREIAASIQRTPMPLTGPLFKFALFRTPPDEYYWFACCHHIITPDRIKHWAGRPADRGGLFCTGFWHIHFCCVFWFVAGFRNCELEYEASADYLQDRAYWGFRIFLRRAAPIIGCLQLRVSMIRICLLRRLGFKPVGDRSGRRGLCRKPWGCVGMR